MIPIREISNHSHVFFPLCLARWGINTASWASLLLFLTHPTTLLKSKCKGQETHVFLFLFKKAISAKDMLAPPPLLAQLKDETLAT